MQSGHWALTMGFCQRNLDAPRGFEPRLTESESVVLPLDDRAVRGVPLSPSSGQVKHCGTLSWDGSLLAMPHRASLRSRSPPQGGQNDWKVSLWRNSLRRKDRETARVYQARATGSHPFARPCLQPCPTMGPMRYRVAVPRISRNIRRRLLKACVIPMRRSISARTIAACSSHGLPGRISR